MTLMCTGSSDNTKKVYKPLLFWLFLMIFEQNFAHNFESFQWVFIWVTDGFCLLRVVFPLWEFGANFFASRTNHHIIHNIFHACMSGADEVSSVKGHHGNFLSEMV